MLNAILRSSKFYEILIIVEHPMYARVRCSAFFIVGTRYMTTPPQCLNPCRHSPKKRRLKHQALNLVPQEKVRAWGTALWGSRSAGLSVRDMNAGFPESKSDDLDWLPPELRQTRTDLRIKEHGQPKCVSAQWARTASQKDNIDLMKS